MRRSLSTAGRTSDHKNSGSGRELPSSSVFTQGWRYGGCRNESCLCRRTVYQDNPSHLQGGGAPRSRRASPRQTICSDASALQRCDRSIVRRDTEERLERQVPIHSRCQRTVVGWLAQMGRRSQQIVGSWSTPRSLVGYLYLMAVYLRIQESRQEGKAIPPFGVWPPPVCLQGNARYH